MLIRQKQKKTDMNLSFNSIH